MSRTMTYDELQRHLNRPLLACPFCGRPAEKRTSREPNQVGCFNPACGIRPKASSTNLNAAIEHWNTRNGHETSRPDRPEPRS